ncbi:hypothetical protein TRVL_04729 [Trypanosoma vivax]|nr:hypothetical protein TRVL_04729 [Trypanosoma vivax]
MCLRGASQHPLTGLACRLKINTRVATGSNATKLAGLPLLVCRVHLHPQQPLCECNCALGAPKFRRCKEECDMHNSIAHTSFTPRDQMAYLNLAPGMATPTKKAVAPFASGACKCHVHCTE